LRQANLLALAGYAASLVLTFLSVGCSAPPVDAAGPVDTRTIAPQTQAATPCSLYATEVAARDILLQDKTAAWNIIAQLNQGADFVQLAKQHSMDGPATGGYLDYFQRGVMVKEFENAAFAMSPGQYSSEPVKSVFGWHVILVVDCR
jgi:parvulin-like peptidyl-prolyl isomerase